VVTTRGDVHYVVSEYGIAYLHGKSIRERVLALINIAHPKFRNDLLQAAKAQKYIQEDQIELAWEDVRYPDELERRQTLRDGTEIFFRPVKPTDEPALSEMLYSLSSQSVRTRYFTHTMTFPHRDVQKVTNIDYKNELAIVGVVPGPAGEEIVAIAQYFLDPKTRSAEVAFIVHDEWQAKGMGRFLLDYITQIAVQRASGKVDTIQVKIPAGIEDGKKIRVRGQGEPGLRGGPSGDILITVRVAAHPCFQRRGNHLHVKVPVTLAEAALGAKVDVPTPRGTVSLSIPAGSSSGTKLRLKGHGAAPENGPSGDLLAEIQIVLPEGIGAADRQMIEEFGRRHPQDPRANLRW